MKDHNDDAVMGRHFRETEAAAERALRRSPRNQNLLPLLRFDHSQFTRSREGGKLILSTEVSNLAHVDGSPMQRVYADACDVGLIVVGAQHEVTYILFETHVNNEGELTHWTLAPSRESIDRVPACKHTLVVLFND